MSPELTLLAWTLVLAIVQTLLAGMLKTRDLGGKWASGPRDTKPREPSVLTGRLGRAQSNLMETLPLFAAAVLIAHVAGREGRLTLIGANLYFWARILYVPLYAAGVPIVRSLIWAVSLAGLVAVLAAVLLPH